MTKRLNRWLLALIVIIGVPYYWLLIDDRPGHVEPHAVSIRQLRDLAQSKPGLAPSSISSEIVAWRYVPRSIVAAGQGVKLLHYSVLVYRLAIPNGPPVMIDSGLSAAAAQQYGLDHYYADKQARINAELKKARRVVTLSENGLHSGAIELAGLKRPARSPDDGGGCPEPRAIAAGVVEIPVCGNVIASRMIYVRLNDGREYLLTGDIAPTWENVQYQAGPSRLMNVFFRAQDGRVIHSWLRTIGQLQKQAPRMIIVPGHAPVPENDIHRTFPLVGTP